MLNLSWWNRATGSNQHTDPGLSSSTRVSQKHKQYEIPTRRSRCLNIDAGRDLWPSQQAASCISAWVQPDEALPSSFHRDNTRRKKERNFPFPVTHTHVSRRQCRVHLRWFCLWWPLVRVQTCLFPLCCLCHNNYPPRRTAQEAAFNRWLF